MKLPHAIIEAAASEVLPGCRYLHGEQAQANVDLDKMTPDDRIVYLDDKMPFRFAVNKYRVVSGAVYSCLLMLLVPSKLDDAPEVREPRVAEMVDASARLMAAIGRHPDISAVAMARPAEVMFNQFDLNADGVTLYLDITRRGGLNYCLPPDQSQA
ncbi:MAG: hypothetical protein ACRYFZ_07250 [Janthinobacterium lividum]